MPYEVDTPDGRCLYRGDDLELACEIHDQDPTAVLVTLPATTERRTTTPWKGPAVTRRADPARTTADGCHGTGRRDGAPRAPRSPVEATCTWTWYSPGGGTRRKAA
jgi:hypothetical protein